MPPKCRGTYGQEGETLSEEGDGAGEEEEQEEEWGEKWQERGRIIKRKKERIKHFTSPAFPFFHTPDLLLPPHPHFPPTSSSPAMPLPLRLHERMMMNRLAARKQNISSRPGIGNWLSTSAEP